MSLPTRREPLRATGAGLLALSAALIVASLSGTWALVNRDVPDMDYHALSQTLGMVNIALAFAASAAWMWAAQGLRATAVLLGLSLAIAGGMEAFGVLTGIPFGSYEYTDRLGPKVLGAVPAAIPLAWFSMAYPAVHIAHRTRLSIVGKASLAGAALAAWDLALDPAMTAQFGAWKWLQGGIYYGIPLQNYLGWFLTGSLLAGAYLWLVREWKPDPSWLPVAMYLLQSVFVAVLALLYGRGWAAFVWLVALMSLALVVARYPTGTATTGSEVA